MMNLLYKLLGIPREGVTDVTAGQLALRGGVHPAVIAGACLGIVLLVYLLYRGAASRLPPGRRLALIALRTLFLGLILGLLLKPVLAFTIESKVRRALIMLLDASSSMGIEDPRIDAADRKRAAIAAGLLDPARGLDQEMPPSAPGGIDRVARMDLYKRALSNPKLNLLPRLAKDYDLRPYAFAGAVIDLAPAKAADGASDGSTAPASSASPASRPTTAPTTAPAGPFGWVADLSISGNQSPIGDAIGDMVARTRGQPLGGIVLVTDGDNNSGIDPHVAAAAAKQAGVPLYVYGVGIADPKDLTAIGVFAPEVSFLKDDVPVTVQVRSQGVRAARVTLELVDEAAGTAEKVDEKEIEFSADGEQAVSLSARPARQGEFRLRATIAAIEPGVVEINTDDNFQSQKLRVIDNKMKVLYVEQSPRWEFKHLMSALTRDPRVDFKAVLLEGNAGLAQPPGSPYLPRLPQQKEEWLAYDLILLGDVDPRLLNESQIEAIEEFVSRFGGGLISIAGKRFNPWAYRNTRLEAMLPVESEVGGGLGASAVDQVFDVPIRPELTPSGRRSIMLRLAPDEQVSLGRWAQLPPIYWAAPVSRAKPAADVLLVDPSPVRASRYGKMPLVAVQPYGLGQVVYIGTDNFWRWRRNAGEPAYVQLWTQIVQRTALPHLLGASKRTQITLDKESYAVNDVVRVFARLYSETYQPLDAETVRGYVTESGPDDPRAREVTLRRLPDQPGMYQAQFNAPDRAGGYKLFVEGDRNTLADFTVTAPRMEPGPTALNVGLLKDLAAATGGAFLREEDLHSLPDRLQPAPSIVRSSLEVELWSSPLYFLLMLSVVTAEWIVRKMSQLK